MSAAHANIVLKMLCSFEQGMVIVQNTKKKENEENAEKFVPFIACANCSFAGEPQCIVRPGSRQCEERCAAAARVIPRDEALHK